MSFVTPVIRNKVAAVIFSWCGRLGILYKALHQNGIFSTRTSFDTTADVHTPRAHDGYPTSHIFRRQPSSQDEMEPFWQLSRHLPIKDCSRTGLRRVNQNHLCCKFIGPSRVYCSGRYRLDNCSHVLRYCSYISRALMSVQLSRLKSA